MLPSIAEYLRLLILPVNQCAFYISRVFTSIAHNEVLAALLLLLAIIVTFPAVFRRWKIASFGILWIFVTLLPVMNIIPLRALIAERFLYLPSIGYAIAVAFLLSRIRRRYAGIALVASALRVSADTVKTIMRNEEWADPVSISASILRVQPLNPWAYLSFSNAYIAVGRYEDGIKELKKAIAIAPSYPAPYSSLGFCYLDRGRYREAAENLERTILYEPESLEIINSLGVTYANLDRSGEAIKLFERSIELDPTFLHAYLNLGTTYERMLEYDKALEQYEKIARVTSSRQDIAISYIRIGDVYMKMKMPDKARELYSKAIDECGNDFSELQEVARSRLEAKWKEE